ncbi:amidohydrolase family protein [Pollutibacter soli]|uniref:amidohydrolase family protein n=1 Tax=Pollutibacter soli TaxID=3034157 RepID=UPI003013E263
MFLFVFITLHVFSQVVVIRNVNVIPMNKEGVVPAQAVIVKNGKIETVADDKTINVPSGAKVIDGNGKFLVPGFFDMHAHFFYEQGENVNTCDKELKVMLANGLTSVRIECGDPVYLNVREQVNSKKITGPELTVASPQFVGAWPWGGKVFAEVVTTPAEAEAAVKRSKAAGYDEIKITFMIKRDVYEAIIKTAAKENIKVTGHVGPLVKLPAGLAAKQQIEHMDEFIDMLLPDTTYNHGQSVSDMNLWRRNAWATVPYLDENKIPALAKMVKDAGIYVTPTNYFFFSCFGTVSSDEDYKTKPDYRYIPAAILPERWSIKRRFADNAPPVESQKKYIYLRMKITKALWESGVPLMAGSDSPEWFLAQGFSIHDEIETFVKCGLSPWAALQTATVNPAKYLGVYSRKGSIEKGKNADFILLNKNPLDDIRNTRTISGIMQGSNWYDRQAIDELLKSALP